MEIITPQRVWTTEISEHTGKRVCLVGWLHHQRQLRNVTFLLLRDARGLAQIVIEDPSLITRVLRLPHESVIQIDGTVVATSQTPVGVEIQRPVIEVIVPAAPMLPVDLFRPSLVAQLPTILDHRPLALRHPRQRAIFRIAAATTSGFRSSLAKMGFVEIHTPKIVASATESGANVFPVDYLGQPAYLAQSPQLYKQMMVGVFERVFEVGSVFRAEPHDTPRHLNEYVSLDAEMGFIRDHTTIIDVLTHVIRGMVAAIRDEARDEVDIREVQLPEIPAAIPSVHFAEAMNLIRQATGENTEGELDLAPAHERWLNAWARQEFDSDFLLVVGFPMAKRPFYTHPDPERPSYSQSFDLLFRGIEVVTGGRRLHHYEDYVAALAARGLDAAPMASYLETFKYGMPPHGGFAIGLERWVARLIGASNVRETSLFPRDLRRLSP